jgi:hypothetical protein
MFHFIKYPDPDNQFDNSKVTVESSEVVLEALLSDFTAFLKACGFQLDGLETYHADEEEI